MRKLLLRKWFMALVLVLALGGFGLRHLMARNGKPLSAKLATVRRMDLVCRVSETGVIQPVAKVDVKSKIGGKILKLPIEEGQEIREGDLVAQLDVDELLPQVQQAEAQLRAAEARVAGAQVALAYQRTQTTTSLGQDTAAFRSAVVKRGQSEIELEVQRKVADAALAEARSAQKASQAQLDQLRAGPRPQEVSQAEQSVASAKARSVEAEKDLTRKLALLKKGYIPQSQVDAVQSQVDVAKAELESAQKHLSLVKEGPRREEILAAEAVVKQREAGVLTATANLDRVRVDQEAVRDASLAVDRARASLAATRNGRKQEVIRQTELSQSVAEAARLRSALRELEARLSYATVLSPASGTVIRRAIEPGELITSGISAFNSGMTICTVADLRKMRVETLINEVDVEKVRVGQTVDVKVDAVPSHKFRGTVTSVSPASALASEGRPGTDSSVVKFLVKIAVENPDRLLHPGMTATCDIRTDRRVKTLALPLDAVRERGTTGLVDVYLGPDPKKPGEPKYREQTVRIGAKTATQAEVFGLKEGTQVRADKRTYVARKKIDVSGGDHRD